MTEFSQELRHYCRNPRCRMRLKVPVESAHQAFCTRGCYVGFFRTRCRVCEDKMERKTEQQLVCAKSKCRNALRVSPQNFRYAGSSSQSGSEKTQQNMGLEPPLRTGRAWFIVAGPELTPNQLRCATVADGPDCNWPDGFFARTEARNRTMVREHLAKNRPPQSSDSGPKFTVADALKYARGIVEP